MSAAPDFDRIYRLLGVDPDRGWEAVRRAYRRRAQALHPDKISGKPEVLRQARERFEQLNAGYRELRRYRNIFGGLPPAGIAAAPTPERTNRQWPGDPPAPRRPKKVVVALVAVVVAAVTAAWLILVQRPGDAGHPGTYSKAIRPAAVTVPSPRITTGTSLGLVHDIEGQPDRIDGETWHYGESTIVFENGRVVGWETTADRPLRTATIKSSPQRQLGPPSRETFRVGSSKSEVARIQGRPLRANDHEWDYGVSKVYFEDDRVVGWFNSAMDPLRVPGSYGRR